MSEETTRAPGESKRAPFPDFENTAELDRELAAYAAIAVPRMREHRDGEELVSRYRQEHAHRTGKHAGFVANFVARYEAADAREAAELPLLKLQAMFALWRKSERLPGRSVQAFHDEHRWFQGGKQKKALTDAQVRIVGTFSELMRRASVREGFLHGRRGAWIVTIPSPWFERAPLSWRLPLPDERRYRHVAIVPALEILEDWIFLNPPLWKLWLAHKDPPGRTIRVNEWLASLGIDARLTIEAGPVPRGMPTPGAQGAN